MICGADNWVAVEEFGLAKEGWFVKVPGAEDAFCESYLPLKFCCFTNLKVDDFLSKWE